jgi:CRP-like cAMP-binding protein
MTALETYIQTYFGVTNQEASDISARFELVTLPKGDFYLRKDRMADRLGFIQSGIIREYIDTEEKEITKWIATQGYFVVDLASFLFGQPARWNLQALTDCELYVIRREEYMKLGELAPKWPELEKLFLARCFGILEDRIMSHLSLTAEERYQRFFDFQPALFNQVPLQYLASLLGMTPETLSRIRKKASG